MTAVIVEVSEEASMNDRETEERWTQMWWDDRLEKLELVFRKADQNGDRSISKQEIASVYKSGDLQVAHFLQDFASVEEISALFDLMDWDASGQLDYFELIEGVWEWMHSPVQFLRLYNFRKWRQMETKAILLKSKVAKLRRRLSSFLLSHSGIKRQDLERAYRRVAKPPQVTYRDNPGTRRPQPGEPCSPYELLVRELGRCDAAGQNTSSAQRHPASGYPSRASVWSRDQDVSQVWKAGVSAGGGLSGGTDVEGSRATAQVQPSDQLTSDVTWPRATGASGHGRVRALQAMSHLLESVLDLGQVEDCYKCRPLAAPRGPKPRDLVELMGCGRVIAGL